MKVRRMGVSLPFVAMVAALVCAASTAPLGMRFSDDQAAILEATGAPKSFDCKMRALAYEYAMHLLPTRGKLQSVFDSLELATYCGMSFVPDPNPLPPVPTFPIPSVGSVFFVSTMGSDSAAGTQAAPFLTLQRAVDATRESEIKPGTVVVRGGTYYLPETLRLTAQDTGLTIQNFNGEQAVISGGRPLQTDWQPFKVIPGVQWATAAATNAVFGANPDNITVAIFGKTDSAAECETACQKDSRCNVFTWHDPTQAGYENLCYFRFDGKWNTVAQAGHFSGHSVVSPNIWFTDLSQQLAPGDELLGLRVDEMRMPRARYPNGNPETTLFPDGWISEATTWTPPTPTPLAETIFIQSPNRTDMDEFQNYQLGLGGPCWRFTPPESYWCGAYASGGGAFVYRIPSGLTLPADVVAHNWKTAVGAIIQAWRPAHWSSWMFEVDSHNTATNQIGWTKGGFQGARGENTGGEWFVENVFEELDAPTEWFYDASTQRLYYFPNSTGAPPATSLFVATRLKQLIAVQATQAEPLRGLTLRGLTFRDTAYTYMDPHGVPSGGDWALERMGAVFLEGTELTTVEGNLFIRLDGNALFLSGYNRNATVQANEFVWIGNTVIASWGHTNGIDGTAGDQPRFTQILNNLIHEMGHFEKQSSPYFQAKTCQTTIRGNVMFNGPRAGVNFNDGFGGGNEVAENLIYNMCRESGDHGPFNSWDREPFLTTVRDGHTASLTPASNDIHHNFLVANYQSSLCVDNDDGSTWYNIHHNFAVYGGHKSDFAGHDKVSHDNIMAYSKVYTDGVCINVNAQLPGYVDGYYNNRCVQGTVVQYAVLEGCDPKSPKQSPLPTMYNNTIYNSVAAATVSCGSETFTEKQWQAFGLDTGTSALPLPSDDEIIGWARQMLSF